MPDLWYYGKNGERRGPIPLKELKGLALAGKFDATDPVWSPGMADWVAASEVEGLLPTPAPSPVSTPEAAATPAVATVAQESSVAEERWHYEYQGERRGPVSSEEIAHLVASGQIQPDSLVWKRGMAEWTPAGQIDGLFPAQSAPADLWYYGDGEQRHGPVSLDELKGLASSGRLQPDHMVWKQGMGDWLPAAQVDGLFSQSASPPPPPPLSEAETRVAEDRWHCEHQGERFGPISFMALQMFAVSGKIQSDNLVWKRGMEDWIPAGQIDGLFPARPETPVQSAEMWYYGVGEERRGPVSKDALRGLASSGWLQPSDLVWSKGMAEWSAAVEVEGLFPVRVESPAAQLSRQPAVPPVPAPSFQERVQKIRDAAAPHLSRTATATRTRLEQFRSFVRRQHLGTRLRLIASRLAQGAAWCYNTARTHIVRVWNKRPSWQEVKDASAAGARKSSETWKRTAPWRTRLAQRVSVILGEAREGFAYFRKATGSFSAGTWDGVRRLGSSFKPKQRAIPAPSPKPKAVGAAARIPPPMPKPTSPVARIPPPKPKPVGAAVRIPPPMPKPPRASPVTPLTEPDPKPPTPATSAPAPDPQPTPAPAAKPKLPVTEPEHAEAVLGTNQTETDANVHEEARNLTNEFQHDQQPKDS
jgi:hypothetical protein